MNSWGLALSGRANVVLDWHVNLEYSPKLISITESHMKPNFLKEPVNQHIPAYIRLPIMINTWEITCQNRLYLYTNDGYDGTFCDKIPLLWECITLDVYGYESGFIL